MDSHYDNYWQFGIVWKLQHYAYSTLHTLVRLPSSSLCSLFLSPPSPQFSFFLWVKLRFYRIWSALSRPLNLHLMPHVPPPAALMVWLLRSARRPREHSAVRLETLAGSAWLVSTLTETRAKLKETVLRAGLFTTLVMTATHGEIWSVISNILLLLKC